jgi:hypothetical protein
MRENWVGPSGPYTLQGSPEDIDFGRGWDQKVPTGDGPGALSQRSRPGERCSKQVKPWTIRTQDSQEWRKSWQR